MYVVCHTAGSADAENPVHVVFVKQLVGIDADGRHPHAAALDGDRNAVISAGIAEHSTDGVVTHGIIQKILCDKLCTQGIARHEDSFCDVAFVGGVMRSWHSD